MYHGKHSTHPMEMFKYLHILDFQSLAQYKFILSALWYISWLNYAMVKFLSIFYWIAYKRQATLTNATIANASFQRAQARKNFMRHCYFDASQIKCRTNKQRKKDVGMKRACYKQVGNRNVFNTQLIIRNGKHCVISFHSCAWAKALKNIRFFRFVWPLKGFGFHIDKHIHGWYLALSVAS